MPPDLVALGDELEAAAGRTVARERRRGRRQSFLNAAAGVFVIVPVAISLLSAQFDPRGGSSDGTPAAGSAKAAAAYGSAVRRVPVAKFRDNPPQILSRPVRTNELLLLPTTLRPALR